MTHTSSSTATRFPLPTQTILPSINTPTFLGPLPRDTMTMRPTFPWCGKNGTFFAA
jgi:hypothetical protein